MPAIEVLTGTMSNGKMVKLFIPEGWTGTYSLVLHIHKGHPSMYILIVMDTTHELVGPETKQEDYRTPV